MKLKFYIPSDKELPFDSLRLAYSTTSEHKIVTTPPFGKPVIIFFVNPNSVKNFGSTSGGILLGQHTEPLILDLNENFKVIAIHLKPYGLKQLLNMDASQLTNKYVGIKGHNLLEELYKVVLNTIEVEKELISAIEFFFESIQLYPISYEVSAFLSYLKVTNPSSISKTINDLGITERNLERKFKSEVGVSPKKYMQICRVFEVFETLKESNDWQQLVVDHNYTDQAHLINEFKKYANIAPGLYVRKGLTITEQLPPITSFDI